jgi:hypothetical protein
MASVTVGLAFQKVSGCFKVWICVFICRFWSVRFVCRGLRVVLKRVAPPSTVVVCVAGFACAGQWLRMWRLVAVPVLFGRRLVSASLADVVSLMGGSAVVMAVDSLTVAMFLTLFCIMLGWFLPRTVLQLCFWWLCCGGAPVALGLSGFGSGVDDGLLVMFGCCAGGFSASWW